MKQEKRSKLAKKQVKLGEEKAPSKMPLVNSKLTKKVNEAQANLEAYLKKNKLDPSKDWTNDKKHGVKVRELVSILNVARDQVKDAAPKEIHHKKSEDKKKKSEATGTRSTYDYPKVDGKEMTPDIESKRSSKDIYSDIFNKYGIAGFFENYPIRFPADELKKWELSRLIR